MIYHNAVGHDSMDLQIMTLFNVSVVDNQKKTKKNN